MKADGDILITLALQFAALYVRMIRSNMLSVLSEDYIRTARAKGVPQRQGITHHAFRNALIPLLTVMALDTAFLFGGLIITEKIFARPGLGTLLLDSIFVRDWKVVQGVVLVVAATYVMVNLATDLLYAFLDPRIRLG